MRVCARTFWLQKYGTSPPDYEDACFAPSPNEFRGENRASIADGATESSFAAEWARLLTESFGRRRLGIRLREARLGELSATWRSALNTENLPWYAEEKLSAGAFAAFLGVSLRDELTSGPSWSAVAVGDSCLFHLRQDRLLAAFPLTHSAHFDNRPFLLGSNVRARANLRAHVRRARGELRSGDRLLLATDALACWFLASFEGGRLPWRELACVQQSNQREEWMRLKREQGELRNDDVTLLDLAVI